MGEFIFEPVITKEYIEQFATHEQLMYMYTGLIPKANKLYKSPFRKEERASCSFYQGKNGELLFRDFGEGKSYSWISATMKRHGCTFGRALRIVAEDLGLIKINSPRQVYKLIDIPKVKNTLTNLQVQIKDFTDEELNWWESFGINEDTLKLYNVFSINTTFINGAIHTFSNEKFPIFGYYFGKKESIEVWKIYMPLNKNKGYRFLTNAKESTIQGWKQLPKEGESVVITKSMKDVMLLHELGIPACAPNSENIFISEQRYNNLKSRFKNIFLLYDSDLTGVKFTNKIRKQYLDVIPLLIPRKYGCKDLSDFYKKFGLSKIQKLVFSVNDLIK